MSTKAESLANELETDGWDKPSDFVVADELRRLAEIERQYLALKVKHGELLATIGEPVAWDVYVAEADNGYLVDSLEDPQLIDDCTNHNAVITPLYAIKDNQP